MAGKDAPSSFKKSPSPAPRLSIHWKPETQLVTQLEAKPQAKPEPVQPEEQLESQGDSQVTSAPSSSTPLLSASISSGERPPQERSLESQGDSQVTSAPSSSTPLLSASISSGERPPQERSLELQGDSQVTSARSSSTPLLSASISSRERPTQEISPELACPLSFQRSLPETKILVERSLSVFVYTDYPDKHRLGSKESHEGPLPYRPLTDPHPGAKSLVLAARARASKSLHYDTFLDESIGSSRPQSVGKPKIIPSVSQSREISADIEKGKNS